jgi:lipid-A-disaccharide synthase-like uncharacterized protein
MRDAAGNVYRMAAAARRRWVWLLEIVLFASLCTWLGLRLIDDVPRPPQAVDLKVQLRDAHDKAFLYRDERGAYRYIVTPFDGPQQEYSADEFAARVYDDQSSRSSLQVLFNITSPQGLVWVSLGLLGQLLFTGRMIVQWLASERSGRSVVPSAFWWMSLVGATMLLAYFLWRKDAVGVLGQGFGWLVYVRNLWLIHGRAGGGERAGATEDPAPEPQSES